MFNDYLGATLNLSQLAHAESSYELRFLDDEAAQLDVSNVTFAGWVTDAKGEKKALVTYHSNTIAGGVVVRFPNLTEGAYKWEVMATDEHGNSTRLVSGRLQVLRTILQLTRDVTYGERTLDVRVPSVAGEVLQLQWNSCIAAEFAVQKCLEYMNRAEQAVKDAVAAASDADGAVAEALGELNALKQAAEAATRDAATALGKLNNLDSLLAEFQRALASQISIDPATNYWIVAGVCSYTKATGEPGKSPKLSTSFTWMVYNDETKQWEDSGVSAVGVDGKSPYLSALNTWVEWKNGRWQDSGVCAEGKDGIDGNAMRRIMVQHEADIPSSGETCTGGYLYYVPVPTEKAQAAIIVPEESSRAGISSLAVDGVTVVIPPETETGTVVEVAQRIVAAINAAALPGVTSRSEGQHVILVSDNATLTVALTGEGYHVEETPRVDGEGYRVYSWMESQNGAAGWELIGEENDVATSRLYGLTKLATDKVVRDGAPTGTNSAGQLSVPLAENVLAGAVKRALEGFLSLEEGGAVTTDEEGHMVAQAANNLRWGVMKHSTGRQATADCIGLLPDGRTGCTMATLDKPGVLRLGSEVIQLEDIPFRLAPGVTEDGRLCGNLLHGGCIRHQNAQWWAQTGMENLPEMTGRDVYTGLVHTPQFSQPYPAGLTLNSATTTMLAGVFIAYSRDDNRGNAVLTAGQTATWYYNKEEVYNKDEVYRKDEVYSKKEVYSPEEIEQRLQFALGRLSEATTSVNEKLAQALADVDTKIATIAPEMKPVATGSILFSACSSMVGFLLCDGSAVSRQKYSALFAAIGTKFGAGDGISTFNLPNMKGRVAQGADGNLGASIEAGLPNIYGEFSAMDKRNHHTGAFSDGGVPREQGNYGGSGVYAYRTHVFNASHYDNIYGKSRTVQPPALALNAFIKY